MTGAGAPGGPGIIRAIKMDPSVELVVCDVNPFASGRFLNEKFERVLPASDINFIPDIIRICNKYGINVIFPLVTSELFILSQYKSYFLEKGISVIVSDFESLEIANDKSALYNHLFKLDIKVPYFKVVNNLDALIRAFASLGYPQNPICIKPSISNGSRGVRIIDNSIDEFDLLFNHKPNSLYIPYDRLIEILKNKDIPELLVSEVLPGDEYTIDTIVSNGTVKIVLPRRRSRMNGGISVAGCFENNLEIIEYCTKILECLNLDGPIGLQVKKSITGEFKLLEINPRIQGTSVASLGMGVNLPLISIYNSCGLKYKIPSLKWGTSFVRYYNEVFY